MLELIPVGIPKMNPKFISKFKKSLTIQFK